MVVQVLCLLPGTRENPCSWHGGATTMLQTRVASPCQEHELARVPGRSLLIGTRATSCSWHFLASGQTHVPGTVMLQPCYRTRVASPCQEHGFARVPGRSLLNFSNGAAYKTCTAMLQTRVASPCQEHEFARVPGRRCCVRDLHNHATDKSSITVPGT